MHDARLPDGLCSSTATMPLQDKIFLGNDSGNGFDLNKSTQI